MTQVFTPELCAHLSSLAPGFEGHWVYGYWGTSKTTSIYCRSAWGITALPENGDKIICPAWQAEDVLRNITEIQLMGHKRTESSFIMRTVVEKIVDCLAFSTPDTAYQKIEEYLWTVLKQPKDEECTKAHCKCMQTNCSNHHYTDDNKVLK